MITTFAPIQARAGRRARPRDSSEDIDTLVYERGPAKIKERGEGVAERTPQPPSRRSPSMILTTPQPHDREMFEAIMSQLSRPLRVLEQSKPLSIAALTIAAPPNVFELPPQPGDPPLPWATEEWLALGDRPTVTARLSYALAYRGRRRRRSMLPFVVLATWLAIGIGVAVDEGARHDVSARVETARVRVTSVLARHAR